MLNTLNFTRLEEIVSSIELEFSQAEHNRLTRKNSEIQSNWANAHP